VTAARRENWASRLAETITLCGHLSFVTLWTASQRCNRRTQPGIFQVSKMNTSVEFYRVLFDARATSSSSFDRKSFRMGDWFDFL